MPTHGKRTTYASYGCRCEECTLAQRIYQRERRYRQVLKGGIPEGAEHGLSGYQNWGCLCDICRAAGSEANKRAQEDRVRRGLPDGDPRHGTAYAYKSWGCRCEPCREAHRVAQRKRYQRRKNRVPD